MVDIAAQHSDMEKTLRERVRDLEKRERHLLERNRLLEKMNVSYSKECPSFFPYFMELPKVVMLDISKTLERADRRSLSQTCNLMRNLIWHSDDRTLDCRTAAAPCSKINADFVEVCKHLGDGVFRYTTDEEKLIETISHEEGGISKKLVQNLKKNIECANMINFSVFAPIPNLEEYFRLIASQYPQHNLTTYIEHEVCMEVIDTVVWLLFHPVGSYVWVEKIPRIDYFKVWKLIERKIEEITTTTGPFYGLTYRYASNQANLSLGLQVPKKRN